MQGQLNSQNTRDVHTDTKKTVEEKNSFLVRAEKAEKEILEMKAQISSNGKEKERESNNIHNNGNDNNKYFDEIVALKENVLRVDSERSMLQEDRKSVV